MITEVSIGKLFIAGVVPGLVMSLILCTAIATAVTMKPTLARGLRVESAGGAL